MTDPCPQQHRHTKCPSDYRGWHPWAERKIRTHLQQRCPGCGLWKIWVKKRKV
jgi:hypothetical protein